jgi:HAD superfamily hydrolase (TIGR01549 family)
MKAQVVFFDIGNTLATTGDLSARRLLAERLRLTEKETKRAGRLIMTHAAESPEDLATPLISSLPRHGAQQIRAAVSSIWNEQTVGVQEIPGAYRLLLELRRMGLKLGIISNIWRPVHEGFRQNCRRLNDLLDLGTFSYREGCKKPSAEIFQRAISRAGCPAGACWMVGDSYELDLEGARRLDMRTLWVLCRPERERSVLMKILRAEKPGPDWVVQSLDEILPLFQSLHSGDACS